MPKDPRIDAYIAKAAPFAQPILGHVRALIHATVPGLDETIKWSMPHFVYQGKNLAGFAAFKAHTAVMIHGDGRQGDAMGQFGKIAKLSDLPDDTDLAAKLLDAKARIETEGTALKPKGTPKASKAEIAMPGDFAKALDEASARVNFEAFSPSCRREYLEWVTEAKREATRTKRIAEATAWIAEGKKRNWKYETC